MLESVDEVQKERNCDDETFILHIDMDAFFAAVEILDHPELAGHPVAVGGSGKRGVVASCNYEARAFGIHSAMPSFQAFRLCPQVKFVSGRFKRYEQVSHEFKEICNSITPIVESVGLDEAFLDIRGSFQLFGSSEEIAHLLKDRIKRELSLECAIGLGRSKLIAKLASKAAKPIVDHREVRSGSGIFRVLPKDEQVFLDSLRIESIWGVGKATSTRLHSLGVNTVGQLRALPSEVLIQKLGQHHGLRLAKLANGDDPSPVVPNRESKSIGHEETFADDLKSPTTISRHAIRMSESVALALRSADLSCRTVRVKVRFGDFSVSSRSHTLPVPINTGAAIGMVANALLEGIDFTDGVRLIGVSVTGLLPTPRSQQLEFKFNSGNLQSDKVNSSKSHQGAFQDHNFSDAQKSWVEVMTAVDLVRSRFGKDSVGTLSMVDDGRLVIPEQREAPWGPVLPKD